MIGILILAALLMVFFLMKSDHGKLSNVMHDKNIQLEMTLEQTRLETSTEELTLIINNTGPTKISLGSSHFEKKILGKWFRLPYDPKILFPAIMQMVYPQQTFEKNFNLSILMFPITKGTYRVVQEFSLENGKSIILADEFVVN